MNGRPYPLYRKSGTDWLGEVPRHWEVERLRFSIRTNPPRSELNGLESTAQVSFVPMEAVGEYGGLNLETEKVLEDVGNGYTYFRDGDVLVAKITPCFENGKGALAKGLANGVGLGTTELHVLRSDSRLDARFLFYLSISQPFRKLGESEMYGAGGQKRVPEDFIKDFRACLPPFFEQQAIASFLDRETVRIDVLITKKQRLVELLQERRTALISQAVTKGLDPGVPMKDSGAEWLGEIPAQWEVKRLKFLLSEALQYGANESAEFDVPEWPRYIRITDLDDEGRLREETFKSLPEEVAEPYLLEDGDLLLARSGATVGKSFLYKKAWGKAAYAGYLIRARFKKILMNPEFAAYFFRSGNYWDWLNSIFIQATIQNVSAEKYANLVLSLPPEPEQRKIVDWLDYQCMRMNALVEKTREGLVKLTEYRSALISAAVTGKIDVRQEG